MRGMTNCNAIYYTSMIVLLLLVLLELPRETISMRILSNSNSPMNIFGINNIDNRLRKNNAVLISVLRGGSDDYDTSSEEEDEDINDEDDDDDDGIKIEEDEEVKQANRTISNIPIKVTIRTNLNIPMLDTTLEIMPSPKRNIESIKLSISRQMMSRPPIPLQRLLIGTKELNDNEILYDLIDNDDEDSDSDEEKDEEDNEPILNLILDTPIPPIDPKFANNEQHYFFDKLNEMSTNDILDLYIGNMISMFYLKQQMMTTTISASADIDDTDITTAAPTLPNNIQMKKDIIAYKEYFINSILNEEIKGTLDGRGMDEDDDEEKEEDIDTDNNEDGQRTRSRRRSRIKGGAKMTVKRNIQKNLNINWGDTIRNSLLFIFFGYFGTTNPITKTLMIYYGAPLCFILQLRFVKIFFKQLFYFVLVNSPSFLRSLLDVPKQILLGLDVRECMHVLYPGWIKDGDEEEEEEEGLEFDDVGDKSDYDEYDDEY